MTVLAINGGHAVRTKPFPAYRTIGAEERAAVLAVIESGNLSGFLGTWSDEFYGGPAVRALEEAWCATFETRHAIAVNSATSGLYAAAGAAGVGPGDEVIVTPFSMSASATAPLVYGALPVFADVDEDIYCLDPSSVLERITPQTRAMIVVDLFGHSADFERIMSVARDRQIVVIEDAAQAVGGRSGLRPAGTLADIGVFSLNRHKNIHCGEGGVVVTDSDHFAERVQLIRNHAESVVEEKGVDDIVNMVGFNYRMTELEAAVAGEQLKKLEPLVQARCAAAEYLTKGLSGIEAIRLPVVRPGVRHVYYVYAFKYDESLSGVSRARVVEALVAEGIPMWQGYCKPLYLQPLYQRKVAIGGAGFPFQGIGGRDVDYGKGLCPVTERLYERELLYTNVCHANVGESDLADVVSAFEKVFEHLDELADRGPSAAK